MVCKLYLNEAVNEKNKTKIRAHIGLNLKKWD